MIMKTIFLPLLREYHSVFQLLCMWLKMQCESPYFGNIFVRYDSDSE